MTTRVKRILAVLIPIALGVGATAYMLSTADEAPRRPATETAHPLRVIEAPALELVPRAVGYGLADADRTWRAVARVPGRLIELHPGMRSGGSTAAGDTLLRIDPTDVEIAIAAAEADLDRLQADLDQIEVEQANSESALEIERESLEVVTAELTRFEALLAKDAASAADVQDRRRTQLTQRQTVLSIESSMALMPGRRASLKAQIAGAQAALDNARRDLSFCEIKAPFDSFLGELSLELGQYVGSQEQLFELYDAHRVRIDAALPQDEVVRLVDDSVRARIVRAILNPEQRDELLGSLFDVTVSTQVGGMERSWVGRVVGARESLDAETRALRLTVVVEQTPETLFDEAGPPLKRGTYCRIEVRAKPRAGVLVVPRSALRDGAVFVLDGDSRMTRAHVQVEFTQGELAVIREGLEAGARVVVSPPSPAIRGMLVDPILDEDLALRMRADAMGTTDGSPIR